MCDCRYIKCIITQDNTLILDADQAVVKNFVEQVRQRLKESCTVRNKSGHLKGLRLSQEAFNDLPYELRVLEAALDNVRPAGHHIAPKFSDL